MENMMEAEVEQRQPLPMKRWWKSKTIWFGVATVVIATLEYYADIVPDVWQPAILAVIGIVQIVLRTMTSEPVNQDRISS